MDRLNQENLRADGWNVIVVWECEKKKHFDVSMEYDIDQMTKRS